MILKLLHIGVPWAAIHNMQESEIAMVLGIHLATEQRHAEQEAATQRQAGHTNNYNYRGRR